MYVSILPIGPDRVSILSMGLSILLSYVSIPPIGPDRVPILSMGLSISLTYRVNFADWARWHVNFVDGAVNFALVCINFVDRA